MKKVYWYTKLRSGENVETRGFIFSDIVKHGKYRKAWAVVGVIKHEIMKGNTLKKVINIIFDTTSKPENVKPDTSLYTFNIPLVAQQEKSA